MLTMPDWQKVYGPYARKDGRKHVVVVTKDPFTGATVSKQTISYPKYLVEGVLLETLPDEMTVDHWDRDFTNDTFENLRVVERGEHIALDVKRRRPVVEPCKWCGIPFELSRNQVNSRAKSTAGPFCSRTCRGRYSTGVKYSGVEKIRNEYTVEYYCRKDEHL